MQTQHKNMFGRVQSTTNPKVLTWLAKLNSNFKIPPTVYLSTPLGEEWLLQSGNNFDILTFPVTQYEVWFVVLDALVCDLKLPIKEISPKAVKKFACFGHAKKPDMWYALPPLVQELFVSSKWNKKSLEDITDAYFISMYK